MSARPTPSLNGGEALTSAKRFQIGAHLLLLSRTNERWTITVDATASDRWYASEAEAWEAGVREADRLDGAVRKVPRCDVG